MEMRSANNSKRLCFACGKENRHGMQLRFSLDPKNSVVRGKFRLGSRYQGPPGYAHGGIIATVVDEAMGKLNRLEDVLALTANISVEYLRSVPLGHPIVVEARPLTHRGRNYWRECTIRDVQGNLLVRSKGRFVRIASQKGSLPPVG